MDDGNDKDQKKSRPDRSQQYLANERTFLAWVRTCIALIGLGFIIAKFGLFIEELKLVLSQSVSEITKTPTPQGNLYYYWILYLLW